MTLTQEDYEKRNLKIYRMHKEHRMTMAAIAQRMGITRERVRQILRKFESA